MSARPAIFYTIAFFILLPIYFWIQPSIKPTSALEQKQESLLKLGNGIDAVTVTSGSESLRFQKDKDGKFYNLVAPPGKFVPHDLMEAMVSLLTSAKSVEVVAEDTTDLAQFGLDHPKSEVTIEGARPAAADQDSVRQRKPDAYRDLRADRRNPESVFTGPEHRVLPVADVPVDRRQAGQERVAPNTSALLSLCHSEPLRRRISTGALASVVCRALSGIRMLALA